MKAGHSILISFVGSNDAGKLIKKSDGAILTLLSKKRFDEVHLLWNPTEKSESNFYKIAKYLKTEILNRKLSNNVILHSFEVNNVTDHNEIYPKLLEFCNSLDLDNKIALYAAISSGTPAMQVCWILLAESGDCNLKLLKSNDPKYGGPSFCEVKLGTGLPKVISNLKEENKTLKTLLPIVFMNIDKGGLSIGETKIPLSPIQFSHYRYFLERARSGKEYERFSGFETPKLFHKRVIEFHKESFPESDLFIKKSERLLREDMGYDMRTFRANISKLNKKIKDALNDKKLSRYFEIETEGKRHSLQYGINLMPEKIAIK